MNSFQSNPFRLFFPLGLFFGIVGVGEWVMWSVGWNIPNIAITHAAFQTQGFLASFVIGFLLTAFPRFTGTSPARLWEIILSACLFAAFFGFELIEYWVLAQFAYIGLILNLLLFAFRRVRHRKKDLPASFVLMGIGFLHAILGSVLIVATEFGTKNYPLFFTGRQMVQLGFLLCMVLGVTGKLAPFLFGYADSPEQEGPSVRRDSRTVFIMHALIGLGVLSSFFIDLFSLRSGLILRAVLVSFHLIWFAGIARPLKKKTTLMILFYISCWMIPAGLIIGAVWPAMRIAALHVVFLGGFSLMIFSFGLLVVLSHSLQAARINKRLIPMQIVGFFVLTALVFRFLAELALTRYMFFLHISSGLWVFAAVIWGGMVLRPILSLTAAAQQE